MPTISIALCTFNGSKYLQEQLTSYMHQTRPPDELIICDDRSMDNTVQIIEEFSRVAPFALKLIVNDHTFGPTKNFEKAIGLCTGDLIALSDQDDIWHPQKLERCEEFLNERIDIAAVFSNAEIVNESLNFLGYNMWQKSAFTPIEQKRMIYGDAVSVLLKHYVVTGATLVFRSDCKSAILPIPPFWLHDAWIALLLASISSIDFVPESLSKYRQHLTNHLGGVRKPLIQQILDGHRVDRNDYYRLELLRYETLHHRLLDLAGTFDVSKRISLLEDKIDHLRLRKNMPRNRFMRLPFIADELRSSRYAKYARNWGSVAMDLFLR